MNDHDVSSDVRAEVLQRTASSYGKKARAVVATVAALVVVSWLNNAKQADDDYRARQYVVTPKLLEALQHAAPKLTQIREAAKTEKGSGVSSVGALFDLLYASTPEAKTTAAARQIVESRGTDEITSLSTQIDAFTDEKANDDEKAKEKEAKDDKPKAANARTNADKTAEDRRGRATNLAALIYARAMAATQRASDLAQFDTQAASKKAKLRDAFDDLNPEKLARTSRPVFTADPTSPINAVQSAFLDTHHPIHTVFDVFWYASLIVAVLGLVYLVLVPLYRLLPFGDTMEKRVDDFFSKRAPVAAGEGIAATLRGGIGIVSALIISAAAIGGPFVHAENNPFSDVPLRNPGESTPDGSNGQQPRPGESGTGVVGGKEVTTPGKVDGPIAQPPGPPLTQTSPDAMKNYDGVIGRLTEGYDELKRSHASLQRQYNELAGRRGPSFDALLTKDEFEKDRLKRDFEVNGLKETISATQSAMKKQTDDETQAREALANRIKQVNGRAVTHALAADRPSIPERVVGTDRYVVTPAAVAAIEARYPLDPKRPENEAINRVVSVMTSAGPLSRTQIEWQIDRAVSAVAGNATPELREVIRRAKQLVVELSRRPR